MGCVINHSVALAVAMTFVPMALCHDCSLLRESVLMIKPGKQQKSSIPGKKLVRKEKRQQVVENIILNINGSL